MSSVYRGIMKQLDRIAAIQTDTEPFLKPVLLRRRGFDAVS